MAQARKTVYVYTDGACRGNPGPGGYGVILQYKAHEKELSGGAPYTTNNRMELLGVIVALSALREPCDVALVSDSRYVTDAINKNWLTSWRASGWRKADRSRVQNVDLWEQLLPLLEKHDVTFSWIKGHAGHPCNERCDKLATAYADGFSPEEIEQARLAAEQTE